MKVLILFITCLITASMVPQQTITLQECYELANKNYPLAKQSELLETQSQYDKEVISKSKLPQISLDAQATYQSDVIVVPIPNAAIEPPNKDQYRATLSVNQLIYNGGATDASLNLKASQLKLKQKEVEVSLYSLKQKINQLYFSILLTQETQLLLNLKKKQLETKLGEVKSGITYGLLLPSSDKILEAELLKLQQQNLEASSNKKALIQTLSHIIGKSLDSSSTFQMPLIETELNTELLRPELELFSLQKEAITGSETLTSKHKAPKLFGFATGGYGNPGLNMLDNSFQPFYTVGIKLSWTIFDWHANRKQRESIDINTEIIDTEAETFKLNTTIALDQQQIEIAKIEAFINSDEAIINLRKTVLQSADSQLKNGVITASAYLTELTNLYEDENTLLKHKIQLQLAKANYNCIKGD